MSTHEHMTSREFRDRLIRRARRAEVTIAPPVVSAFEAYFRLLAQWNAKINLTALPLREPTDETFDRLLVEPLAAARLLKEPAASWFDLGSGGGSPAIPLKIVLPASSLTMVESKVRKAAFLREAIRALHLKDSFVENVRFEDLAENESVAASADLVTVRAVKMDKPLFKTASRLLRANGRLLLFGFVGNVAAGKGFSNPETFGLTEPSGARLALFRRVFHVEQGNKQT
jgi:16S rRNA (guanine527-N7)-methyltransferase